MNKKDKEIMLAWGQGVADGVQLANTMLEREGYEEQLIIPDPVELVEKKVIELKKKNK